jgi:hypothetical protein
VPEYTPAPASNGDASPLTTKGDLYGFDTEDNRIAIGINGQVLTADSTQALGLKWATSVAGANTLDQAYDQGGAGSGRQIDADSGPVEITVSDTDNNAALRINQQDTTNNPQALSIFNAGTGPSIDIEHTAATGAGILIHDNGSAARNPNLVLKQLNKSITLKHADGNLLEIELPDASKYVHIPIGGLAIGGGATVVGSGITAGDGSSSNAGIVLGDASSAEQHQVIIGRQTTGGTYTSGVALVGLGGENIANTFSNMTAVIDSGNQSVGPQSTTPGAVPVPPGTGGIGNVYLDAGAFFSGSADYAEMFEWDDGNANQMDRRGFFVSLTNGNKIVAGGSDIIGVISARPVIVGDAAELGWHGRHLHDEFGLPLYERIDGQYVPQTNPSYDPTLSYTSRRDRKEWGVVGLMGKLYVRSAQVLSAGSRCTSNSSGYAITGSDYRILRIVRQATTTKYGIIEILMK